MDIDKRRRALVDLLLNQMQRSGVVSAIVMTFTGFVLWDAFPHETILLWGICGYSILFGRIYILRFLHRRVEPVSGYILVEKAVLLIIFISGLIWGSTAFLFVDAGKPAELFFMVIAVSGMTASALPAFSSRPLVWVVFAFAVLCPYIYKLYDIGYWQVASLGVFNLIGLGILSRNLSQRIGQSITLDFKNTELLEEVTAAKEDAEKANLDKSRFLASVCHDLRQPLHAQGILLEALRLRLEAGKHNAILTKTIQSNEALNSLFNSLMEISRLDAGAIKPRLNHHLLKPVIDQVLTEFQPFADEKNLELINHCQDEIIFSDPVLLNRILRHLLSNAVKYTEAGEISVYAEKCNGSEILLSIRDTGIGIDESRCGQIFDVYTELDKQDRDRSKAIGLGLAVVGRLCELLRLSIDVESEVGKGSCFRLEIPGGDINKVAAVVNDTGTESMADIEVLIVEDDQTILEAMDVILTDWNCTVKGYRSLAEAEADINTGQISPDLIVSGFRLEDEVTGLDVVKRLRKLLQEDVPSILISGGTDPALARSIRQQGFYLLNKPLKPNQLNKVMHTVLGDRQHEKLADG